ncbi:hypothetical protein FOZ62_000697 [Perkinsus olseni]|nr:hypothetical protein FOZ62_000697 [Perkinsus olseni]
MRSEAADLDQEAAEIRSGLRAKKRTLTINNGATRRQLHQARRTDRTSVAPKIVVPPRAVLNLDYATLWKQHERAWEKFSLCPPERLKFEDIPWPPCDSDVLEFTEKRILLCNSSEDIFLDRESKDRASYRAACRRWHPDKFSQVYGRSIADPRESQQIMHKLTMIMQAVNESWKDRTTRSHIRKVNIPLRSAAPSSLFYALRGQK